MLLEAVFAAFVLTQLCYLVVNCGLCSLFVRRPTNVVDERTPGRALEAASKRRDNRRPTRVHADGGYVPVGGDEPIDGTETAAGVSPRSFSSVRSDSTERASARGRRFSPLLSASTAWSGPTTAS